MYSFWADGLADEFVERRRGLYVPDDERWPEHFRGMGIRIEDSVCVREENPLVLTTEAVKEVCGLLTPGYRGEVSWWLIVMSC